MQTPYTDQAVAKAREAHLSKGLEASWLDLAPGHTLWRVTVKLARHIHQPGEGWWSESCQYAIARSDQEAVQAVERWLKAIDPKCAIVRLTPAIAVVQHPALYTNPTQIRRLDKPAVAPSNPLSRGVTMPTAHGAHAC